MRRRRLSRWTQTGFEVGGSRRCPRAGSRRGADVTSEAGDITVSHPIFSSSSYAPRVVVLQTSSSSCCRSSEPCSASFRRRTPRGLDTALPRLMQELPGLSGGLWEVSYDPLIPWLLAVLIATLWRAAASECSATCWSDWSSPWYSRPCSPPRSAPISGWACPEPPSGASNAYLCRPAGSRERVDRYCVASPVASGDGSSVWAPSPASHSSPRLRSRHWAGCSSEIAGAATAHLIFGSPGGQLSWEEVSRSLE